MDTKGRRDRISDDERKQILGDWESGVKKADLMRKYNRSFISISKVVDKPKERGETVGDRVQAEVKSQPVWVERLIHQLAGKGIERLEIDFRTGTLKVERREAEEYKVEAHAAA